MCRYIRFPSCTLVAFSWTDQSLIVVFTPFTAGLVEFVMAAGQPVEVGRGVYGCVFLGRLGVAKNQSCLVAIKLFKKHSRTSEADIMREASIMHHLNSHKVSPHLFGLTIIEDHPMFEQWGLVFEFIGNETTFEVLGKQILDVNITLFMYLFWKPHIPEIKV